MTATRGIAFAAFLALAPLLSMARVVVKQPVSHYTFSLSLIHRDAPNSPMHDPKHSYYEQIRSAVARSFSRPKLFLMEYEIGDDGLADGKAIDIISSKGEYLMNISIGKPLFPFMAMVDTTNDLTWTQCQPYKSLDKQQALLFDPRRSSTFRPSLDFSTDNQIQMRYPGGYVSAQDWTREVSYRKISSRSGRIGVDTITLGAFEFKNTEFGCKFSKRGAFNSIGSGVVGLGCYSHSDINSKYSYCLTSLSDQGTKSSTIRFGENSIISSGDDVVSTGMFNDHDYMGDSYSLILQAITVDRKRVTWPTTKKTTFFDAVEKEDPTYRNMIIDLGTPLLMLPSTFYDAVESEIRNQVNAKPVEDPSNQLKLCYHSDGFKPPELVSNFKGGDVKLNDFNARLATSDNVMCFAAAPSRVGIYGNLAQRNFWVEFDKKTR